MSALTRWAGMRRDEQWKRRQNRKTENDFKAQWMSKMKRLMKCGKKMPLVFIASCLINGCVIKTQAPGVLFCDAANPIYVSREDFMTEETERQLLIHNTIGERLCEWGHLN
ncbi:hypothetical protein HMPREF1604_00403 [Escherichia coli 908519]|nr:hypothetical protein HMPREF1604_00403 [Escherichia coli 908519]